MATGVQKGAGRYRRKRVEDGVKPAASSLAEKIEWFEAAEDATIDARRYAERDRDYYDGKQLSAEEIRTLNERGQPALVINKIKRKVDFLKGVEARGRTDPRAMPRTPQDEDSAHAATDALRYVADAAEFPQARSAVWENMIVEGFGGAEVVARHAGETVEIDIVPVPWDRLFYDPHSRRHDFSDAKYLGIVLWMDADDVRARWPDTADDVLASAADGGLSDTYDDRPRNGGWWDGKRERLRVVQMYYQDAAGEWYRCVFARWGELEPSSKVPYLDDHGRTECPLIMQSAYVDRDNRRYGAVREMIDPQDEFNKRRSKALHHFTVRQIVAERGAVDDVDASRKELAKPDGYIEVQPGMRFEPLPTTDMAAGHFQLMQQATMELEAMGPNAAMLGKDADAPSGRAIIANQQGGMVELGPLTDGLKWWQQRIYRACWNRVRQFWDGPRWVRVTDDEKNLRFVGLNQPETLRDKLAAMEPAKAEAIANDLMLVPGDPRLQMVVGTKNALPDMTIDILVDDVPDTVSLQQEEFTQLADLARAGVPIPPDVLIGASTLRNKGELVRKMSGAGPNGEPPPPSPEQAAKAAEMHLEQQKLALEGEKLKLEARKLEIDAMESERRYEIEMAKLRAQVLAPPPLQGMPTIN